MRDAADEAILDAGANLANRGGYSDIQRDGQQLREALNEKEELSDKHRVLPRLKRGPRISGPWRREETYQSCSGDVGEDDCHSGEGHSH